MHWVYSTKFLTSSRAQKKDMRTKGSREEKSRKKQMRMQEKKTGWKKKMAKNRIEEETNSLSVSLLLLRCRSSLSHPFIMNFLSCRMLLRLLSLLSVSSSVFREQEVVLNRKSCLSPSKFQDVMSRTKISMESSTANFWTKHSHSRVRRRRDL